MKISLIISLTLKIRRLVLPLQNRSAQKWEIFLRDLYLKNVFSVQCTVYSVQCTVYTLSDKYSLPDA